MQHGSRTIALCAAIALSLASCGGGGGGGESTKDRAAAGKKLFAANGCGGCHTLAAAGSSGKTGPDLDIAAPNQAKVIDQLKHGGGVMPSFAGKLSAEQMRDLAAFVGSTEGAQGAVAAPFKANGITLADCRDKQPECLEQAFGNLALKEGPKIALARLESMQASDPAVLADCHRIAHRMGSAALVRFKGRVAKAFIAGSPVCASGYYHGIVERAFLGQPRNKLGAIAGQLCDDPEINAQRFLAYQCIHGLGHGLMIYTGYDMPFSLRTCDGLKDEFTQVSCTGGVFMENFSSSYGVRSKYLRANDPIYPCDSVVEKHKAQCYGLVTSNLLRVTNYDLAKTAAGCRRSEPAWVGVCFRSFGRDASGIAHRSARKALASCRLAKSNEADCIYGVSTEIVNSDAGGTRAARFCRLAPADTKGRCFNGVGSVMASLVADPVALRRECAKLSGRFAASCAEGAGLPPA